VRRCCGTGGQCFGGGACWCGAPLAELSLPAGGSVGWNLAGAAAVTPTVDGATATYPRVLPETDLELTARVDRTAVRPRFGSTRTQTTTG
jgi:hypothetical protein